MAKKPDHSQKSKGVPERAIRSAPEHAIPILTQAEAEARKHLLAIAEAEVAAAAELAARIKQ